MDIEINGHVLKDILDYSSDEIFVLDGEKRIVYVNRVCEKHYGLKPQEVIGKYNTDLLDMGLWKPSIVPLVFKEKKPVTIRQKTYIGAELLTTAVPVLNEDNEIELIVTAARELQTFMSIKNEKEKQKPSASEEDFPNIITNSAKMKELLKVCEKIAGFDSTILIQGESGTGKSVLANYIHEISNRKSETFLKINCAALPEELLESELFGYMEGSFTGAKKKGKMGLIEAADKGTLFLDEIGEMPLSLQAKLLQVLQDKQFIPIGGHQTKTVDIRIIAATNRDLEEMVKKGQFREDLFYRLNIIDLTIPSLRERKEDIIPLAYNFLHKINKKYNMNKLISQECLDLFDQYSWPGNIRQLENLMERLIVTSDSIIQLHDLPEIIVEKVNVQIRTELIPHLDDALNQVKRSFVRKSYTKHRSTRKVAKDLNISQTRAVKLINEYCKDLIED
ncbi:AAA domain-containing protein [Niallia endozanthoxylica]|uniref:AAA domain-containing protein n=2 Tax=Niallia endozanthoxylica TaxID=2036016 RepID=A0A5J5HY64_9BACI|nr:AAA domain-containing protein [Niallia endozanthoxylica]